MANARQNLVTRFFCTLLVLAFLPWMAAQAANFPERTVRLVVGIAPGGATDAVARVLAQKLSDVWGQAVIVENRTGGEGTIASNTVAHAAPDGHTLLLVTTNFTLTPNQFKVAFDAEKSFAPITTLGQTPELLIVNPATLPVNSLAELIALARAKPGTINFGTGGTSSPTYMITKLMMKATGIEMVNVSYHGMGPALVALLGGEVQMMFGAASDSAEHIKSGKLRAIAVSTAKRTPQMPDVPSVAEAANIPGFDATAWYGLLAPAGTPPAVIAKLHDDVVAVLADPAIAKRLQNEGFLVQTNTPAEFGAFIHADLAKWAEIYKDFKTQ